MHTYDGARSLKEFGVNMLTGEACGLAMRVLCDLTEDGVSLIQEFMRVDTVARSNWNPGSEDDPHIASVMLPHCIFQDLWIFAHVRRGTKDVFLGGHIRPEDWTETVYESIGETHKHPVKTWTPQAWAIDDEKNMARIRDHVEHGYFYITRTFAKSKHPGTGLDNTHAMSGRTT